MSLYWIFVFVNICIVVLFVISDANINWLFVIIKQHPPRAPSKEDDIVQEPEEHGANVEVQVNDHDMEEDG